MKECPRCKIVFLLEERLRCLYCDTLLMKADKSEISKVDSAMTEEFVTTQEHPIERLLAIYKEGGHGRMQYLVGSYFKARTFHFMYVFSRNEFKWGREYQRLLIQPLNFSVFLTIPWVLVNLIDSLFFRMIYNGYCPKCRWKYRKFISTGEHRFDECGYNREYITVVQDILTGNISRKEAEHKKFALQKTKLGQRSAYHDLCKGKDFFSGWLDVASIWFSISLIFLLIVCLTLPLVVRWFSEARGLMLI